MFFFLKQKSDPDQLKKIFKKIVQYFFLFLDFNVKYIPDSKLMTELPPEFGTPGRYTPKRDAKTKARHSIAYQTALFKRRSLHPFKFEFSEKIDERTDQVAEILNNISIGNFDEEINEVDNKEEEDLLSDDENENQENIEEKISENSIDKNTSSDTVIICKTVDGTKPEETADTDKSEDPKISVLKESLSENLPKQKPPTFQAATTSTLLKSRTFTPNFAAKSSKNPNSSSRPSTAAAKLYRKPNTTPHSAFRPKPLFNLSESLKKKPSWKMHTGKLKPLGSYTPEARLGVQRIQKMKDNREQARKEALAKFRRKTTVFETSRGEFLQKVTNDTFKIASL